jgi:thermitase
LNRFRAVAVRRATFVLLVAASAAQAAGGGERQVYAGPDVIGGYSSDHLVVRFTPVVAESARIAAQQQRERRERGVFDPADAQPPAAFGQPLQAAWRQWGVTGIHRFADGVFANAALAAQLGLDRTFILEVPRHTDVPRMAAAFAAFAAEVEWAEPDGIGTVADLFPNDPFFEDQYNMNNTGQTGGTVDADIDAPQAWGIHTGDLGTVTLAIVDAGVTSVADFSGRVLTGINTAGTGSFTTETSDACDAGGVGTGHGTHVTGIAAAGGNNNLGVAGINWGVSILPVKVFASCSGNETDTAEGIQWAADHGADIINISLQFNTGTVALQNAVDYAAGAGVLVVAAAGNTGYNCGPAPATVCFPARWSNVVAVSATNDDDLRSTVSRYGPEVDIAAPGESILSTFRNGGFGLLGGTSMASPHVAGVAALMLSLNPSLTATQLRTLMETNADDLLTPGFDDQTGNGRVNAYRSLVAALPQPLLTTSSPPDGAIDAAQPSDPDGSNPAGWQFLDLTILGASDGLVAADFTASQEGDPSAPPVVLGVVPQGADVYRVVLSRKISAAAWTTIACIPCGGASVRLGFLPGDVTGDGTADLTDVDAMLNAVDGLVAAEPDGPLDLNRSGLFTSADLLRLADLLNGGDDYDAFLGVSLP